MSHALRPTVATVFGVLDVILGSLGVFSIFSSVASFRQEDFAYGSLQLLNVISASILLYAGILMLTNKKKALLFNKIAAYLAIAVTLAISVFLVINYGIGGLIGAIFVIGLNGIYPILLLVILVRTKAVIEFYGNAET